jgi:hypothetical protein
MYGLGNKAAMVQTFKKDDEFDPCPVKMALPFSGSIKAF